MATEDLNNTADSTGADKPETKKKNLYTILREWPLNRKIALGAVTLLSIVIFGFLIIQARVADYQLLYANLSEADAGSVVTWLKGQNIPYQLKNNGRNRIVSL